MCHLITHVNLGSLNSVNDCDLSRDVTFNLKPKTLKGAGHSEFLEKTVLGLRHHEALKVFYKRKLNLCLGGREIK